MHKGMRLPFEKVGEPVIGALFQYWNDARQDAASLPLRGQIDPAGMPRLLPYVALLEVLTEEPWFRCRVAGSEVEQHFGRSLRGATLGDFVAIVPEEYDIERQYRDCIAERQPIYCLHRYINPGGKALHYHRLALPISDDTGRVSHLLLGFRFRPWSEAHT